MDAEISHRLAQIEAALNSLLKQRTIQRFYSTEDVAEILGKSAFTVREWCRLGRVSADKRACGRGSSQEWIIAHDELERIRAEGLLPMNNRHVGERVKKEL